MCTFCNQKMAYVVIQMLPSANYVHVTLIVDLLSFILVFWLNIALYLRLERLPLLDDGTNVVCTFLCFLST